MNIKRKKQKHIENWAKAPTLRQTIRYLCKLFAKRNIVRAKINKELTKCMRKADRKLKRKKNKLKEIPIPEGYSRLEDVLARSKARREGKNNADNE